MKFLLLSLLAGLAAGRAVSGRAATEDLVRRATNFQYLGRVNPSTNQLTWPGTGIRFCFTGTSASIGLASIVGSNSAELVVDGGTPTVISNVTGTSISTPAGLANAKHTVILRKRSETALGTFVISGVTTSGTFCTPTAPTRQITFIGDSITVGFGLDGTAPCSNTAALEDEPKTYAALTATAVGADAQVIAWSGKGIVRNINSNDPVLISELYTRYGANDADNSYPFSTATWNPAAVVINIGTNDFNSGGRAPLNATTYNNTLVSFVKTAVWNHYPKAQIFLLSSPMLSGATKTTQTGALQSAVAQLGAQSHFVDWPTQGSAQGCAGHPNAATHAAEAKVLTSALQSVLKW